MHVESAASVPAPLEDVWAWWTDYGPEGTAMRVRHGIGTSERRVLARDAERVVLEERLPFGLGRALRHEIRLRAEDHCLMERDLRGGFESTWRFEAIDGGTRVTRVVKANGAFGFVPPPLARALVARDLRHHAREAARDLTG